MKPLQAEGIILQNICQSCGMPMTGEGQFGTNVDGSRNAEYCGFCFKEGRFSFTGSYEEFLEIQVKIAQERMNMPEDKAREMASSVLPTLKRWKD